MSESMSYLEMWFLLCLYIGAMSLLLVVLYPVWLFIEKQVEKLINRRKAARNSVIHFLE